MAFSFNPDGGLPRLIRYVEPGTLPSKDLLALWDEGQNLLIVDRDYFERLSDMERRTVLRTQLPYLTIQFPANRPPTVVEFNAPFGRHAA